MVTSDKKIILKFFIFTSEPNFNSMWPEPSLAEHWSLLAQKQKKTVDLMDENSIEKLLTKGVKAVEELCSVYTSAGFISGLIIDKFIIGVNGKEIVINLHDLSSVFWPGGLQLTGHEYLAVGDNKMPDKDFVGYFFNFNSTFYAVPFDAVARRGSLNLVNTVSAIECTFCIANEIVAKHVFEAFKHSTILSASQETKFFTFCSLKLFNHNPRLDLSFENILIEMLIVDKDQQDKILFEIDPEAKKALIYKTETKSLVDRISLLDFEVFKKFVTVLDDENNIEEAIRAFNEACNDYCDACDALCDLDQRGFEQSMFSSYKGRFVFEYDFSSTFDKGIYNLAEIETFTANQNFYTFLCYFFILSKKKTYPIKFSKPNNKTFSNFVTLLRCLAWSYVRKTAARRRNFGLSAVPFFEAWLESEKQEGLKKHQDFLQKMFKENFQLSLDQDLKKGDVYYNFPLSGVPYKGDVFMYVPKHELFIFFKLVLLFFGANADKKTLVSEFFKHDAVSTWESLRYLVSDSDTREAVKSEDITAAKPIWAFLFNADEQIPRKDVRRTLRPLYDMLKNHGIDGSREWRAMPNFYKEAKAMLLELGVYQKQKLRFQLSYNKKQNEVFFEFSLKT